MLRTASRIGSFAARVATLAVVLSGTGCGLFGHTRAHNVAVPTAISKPIALNAVALEPGQTRLQNVGTFALGEYDTRDIDHLKETMQSTLAVATSGAVGDAYAVHVVVRKALVAHSNNEGFAVACVAWALTDHQGGLVFEEQFYASDHVKLWGTIGGIKNHVHEGITRHIIAQAGRVAAGENPAPVAGKYAHATYEAATAGFPSQLVSVHVSAMFLGGGYSMRITTYRGESDRDWARRDDHVDWDTQLGHTSDMSH